MSTNLTTGQTDLELINIVPNFSPQIPTSFEEPTLAVTPVILGYAKNRGQYSSVQSRACQAFSTNPISIYMSSSSSPTTFANAEFLYQDPSGTTPLSGLYSDGNIIREFWSGLPNDVPTANCS